MAERAVAPRLNDIPSAIRRIERYVENKDIAAYAKDDLVRDAVERCIEVTSEASRHIPENLKASAARIPWSQIAGAGNILRHAYHRTDDRIVWTIIEERLPRLKDAVERMMITISKR